jgi:hypothetical protein
MRFIVFVKASKESEAGQMPSQKLLTDMTAYNEQLVQAGVMQAGEGIQPSAKGVRIQFGGEAPKITPGPFATNEVIAGFWLWKTKTKEEAIDWAKRAPFEDGAVLELRQIFEAEDFGAELTPELREREQKLRTQTEKKQK